MGSRMRTGELPEEEFSPHADRQRSFGSQNGNGTGNDLSLTVGAVEVRGGMVRLGLVGSAAQGPQDPPGSVRPFPVPEAAISVPSVSGDSDLDIGNNDDRMPAMSIGLITPDTTSLGSEAPLVGTLAPKKSGDSDPEILAMVAQRGAVMMTSGFARAFAGAALLPLTKRLLERGVSNAEQRAVQIVEKNMPYFVARGDEISRESGQVDASVELEIQVRRFCDAIMRCLRRNLREKTDTR